MTQHIDRILPLPYLPTYIARLVFDRICIWKFLFNKFLVVRLSQKLERRFLIQYLQQIGKKHRIIMQKNIVIFMLLHI
jgi:hypothetical protein